LPSVEDVEDVEALLLFLPVVVVVVIVAVAMAVLVVGVTALPGLRVLVEGVHLALAPPARLPLMGLGLARAAQRLLALPAIEPDAAAGWTHVEFDAGARDVLHRDVAVGTEQKRH